MSRKIRIGVCDDDGMVLGVIAEAIREILNKNECVGEIEKFSSPQELVRALKKEKYSLLFLDIDMPELDGITLAQKICERYRDLDIIFVSNREDKVFDALSVHPFGFVRKSVFLKDIAIVLEEWLARKPNLSRAISLQVPREGRVLLPVNEIIYIEGSKKDQIVHLNKRDAVVVRSTMDELEEMLKDKGFIRCHKGFLVNCSFIYFIRYDLVVEMRTGEKIPVSRAKLQQVKEEFLTWIEDSGITTIK